MYPFDTLESEVRSYCRTWPTVFDRAKGWMLIDENGDEYLDFFAGAGVLNYGHNHPDLIAPLLRHIERDGIIHGLDMATTAKAQFLERFNEVILQPRGLEYRVQFPGPTGTNAVEAALKLARKVTGREKLASFTNAFHGMTLGSLAVTGNAFKRRGAGVPLTLATSMPYEGFLGDDIDTIQYLESFIAADGSGMDVPAAVIVETIQAEGGVNVASFEWLRELEQLCRRHDILLIIDDIQVGCGRTGPFFSWEEAGIEPDVVCLSKAMSGVGLPMAIALIKPELDVWEPGEHNGTFRGNNAAFVTATATLEHFWQDDSLSRDVLRKAQLLHDGLAAIAADHLGLVEEVRGRGLIKGLKTISGDVTSAVVQACFERGMIVETAGAYGEVVKFLPPLIVDDEAIQQALLITASAVQSVAKSPVAEEALKAVQA